MIAEINQNEEINIGVINIMKWYVAHIVMQVSFKETNQSYFPVWENIHLIQASSDEEAEEKANQIGVKNEGDSEESFFWDEKPAYWKFIGLRKLMLVSTQNNRITDGCELSYLQFEFASEKDLINYINGKETTSTIQR